MDFRTRGCKAANPESTQGVRRAGAEFNSGPLQAQIPGGAKVLDVGAWSCYLGQLLRDRLGMRGRKLRCGRCQKVRCTVPGFRWQSTARGFPQF